MSDTKVERRLRFAVEFQNRLDAGEDIHSAYVAACGEVHDEGCLRRSAKAHEIEMGRAPANAQEGGLHGDSR